MFTPQHHQRGCHLSYDTTDDLSRESFKRHLEQERTRPKRQKDGNPTGDSPFR